jgi:hypothetical protein
MNRFINRLPRGRAKHPVDRTTGPKIVWRRSENPVSTVNLCEFFDPQLPFFDRLLALNHAQYERLVPLLGV